MKKYLVSIGLETHVQLKTNTKMFCGCRLSTEDPPNTTVCPVCLGPEQEKQGWSRAARLGIRRR